MQNKTSNDSLRWDGITTTDPVRIESALYRLGYINYSNIVHNSYMN